MTYWMEHGKGGPKYPAGLIPGAKDLFFTLTDRVTFLSIRPPILNDYTTKALQDYDSFCETCLLLAGSFKSGASHVLGLDGKEKIAGRGKAELFLQYQYFYPESTMLLFGDTGEGD